MPRVARNKVSFIVDSEEWSAEFYHEHAPEGEYLLSDTKKLRHTTLCEVIKAGDTGISIGQSFCSIRDDYQWRKGIKLSFERALEVRGISPATDKLKYGKFMGAFFREMSVKEQEAA